MKKQHELEDALGKKMASHRDWQQEKLRSKMEERRRKKMNLLRDQQEKEMHEVLSSLHFSHIFCDFKIFGLFFLVANINVFSEQFIFVNLLQCSISGWKMKVIGVRSLLNWVVCVGQMVIMTIFSIMITHFCVASQHSLIFYAWKRLLIYSVI